MTETLTAPSQELVVLLQKSGLDNYKTNILSSRFANYFEIAEQWKAEAQSLIVTDESQTELMKRARQGRLVLKDKRIAIEHTRKELKEDSLKEGRAIDAVAKLLTGLIEPTEQFLLQQEEFAKRAEAQRQIALQQLITGRRQLLREYNDDDTDDHLTCLTDKGFDLRLQVAERNFTKKEEARTAEAEAQRKADQRNRDELLLENQRLQAEAQKLREAEQQRQRAEQQQQQTLEFESKKLAAGSDKIKIVALADQIKGLSRTNVSSMASEQAVKVVSSAYQTLDKIQHWLREQAETL